MTRPTALRRIVGTLAVLSVLLATVGTLLLIVGAEPLSRFYREPTLAPLFRLGAALLFVSLVGAFLASAVQGFRLIDTLAAVTAVKAVVALGATVMLLPSLGLVRPLAPSRRAMLALVGRPLRPRARRVPDLGTRPGSVPTDVRRALGVVPSC